MWAFLFIIFTGFIVNYIGLFQLYDDGLAFERIASTAQHDMVTPAVIAKYPPSAVPVHTDISSIQHEDNPDIDLLEIRLTNADNESLIYPTKTAADNTKQVAKTVIKKRPIVTPTIVPTPTQKPKITLPIEPTPTPKPIVVLSPMPFITAYPLPPYPCPSYPLTAEQPSMPGADYIVCPD